MDRVPASLVAAKRRHTVMFPFEHHRHILLAGDSTDLIGGLFAQSLLQLQAMCKLVRYPREFREAKHFSVEDVTRCKRRVLKAFLDPALSS